MTAFIPQQFQSLLAGAFLSFLIFVLFLNIFGLPANWIILGLDLIWEFFLPGSIHPVWLFWAVLIILALTGEALEFLLQVAKAAKYGSSSSGTWGAVFGAIIGAILFAPLFWGLGAFIGALAGAWTGCLIMELCKGRDIHDSMQAALGAMLGRFLGTVCKIGIGAAMIAWTGRHIWPAAEELPQISDPLLAILKLFSC